MYSFEIIHRNDIIDEPFVLVCNGRCAFRIRDQNIMVARSVIIYDFTII